MTDEQLKEIAGRHALYADNDLLSAMREAVQKGIEDAFFKYVKDIHSAAFKKFKEVHKQKELENVRKYTEEHGMITWDFTEDELVYLDYLKSQI